MKPIRLFLGLAILLLMIGCSMMGASDANGNHFWGLFPKELAPILHWGSGHQTTATPTPPSGNGSATNQRPSVTPTSSANDWPAWLDFNHFTPPPPTLDELNSKRLNGLMWAGIGMIVLGVGTYILRAYFPLISGTAGTYLLVAGAATVAASFLLADIPPWLWWIVLGVGILGLLLHFQGFSLNKKAASTTTTTATSTTTVTPPTIQPSTPLPAASPVTTSASSTTQTGATQ